MEAAAAAARATNINASPAEPKCERHHQMRKINAPLEAGN
jgi:hypothetical protein